MKLLYFNYLILELSAVLDRGELDISINDAKEHIERGDLIPWLRERTSADLSLMDDDTVSGVNKKLNEILEIGDGRERRKWGVENNGLCLLISWTNEILQEQAGQQEMQD